MQEELNVTNVVHPHLRVRLIVVVAAAAVIIEAAVVVVDMVVIEVEIMEGVGLVSIMVVEVVVTMVEVGEAVGVVLMEKKKADMVRLLQQHPNLIMEGLVGTIHRLITHMVRTQIMDWMQFLLHLQTLLEGPHHIPLMGVPLRVVMVVMVLGMEGVGPAHPVDMMLGVVLVVEVDMVVLLLRIQLR